MTRLATEHRPTAPLRFPPSNVSLAADGSHHLLGGRRLENGSEVEVCLRGNRGWSAARVVGLPERIMLEWAADDGRVLRATLPSDAQLRWP